MEEMDEANMICEGMDAAAFEDLGHAGQCTP